MTPVHLPDGEAALALIRRVKAEGPSAGAADALRRLADTLFARNVGTVCVACTEFSLMAETLGARRVVDSLDALVDAIKTTASAHGAAERAPAS